MHDPNVVAFNIRRPWPKREKMYDAKPGRPRWKIRYRHDECHADCTHGDRTLFPWWRPSSYRVFWTLAGRGFYWPSLITVWHVEPNNRDSGEVCKHFRQTPTNPTRPTRPSSAWKWHVHHWRVQIHPLQALRRWALTRCEWCHGRSTKHDRVSISHQWDHESTPWWRGEKGLFHYDCSSIENAHRACLCPTPNAKHTLGGSPYGKCARCGKYRAWRTTQLELQRALAAIPQGQRDPDIYSAALKKTEPTHA